MYATTPRGWNKIFVHSYLLKSVFSKDSGSSYTAPSPVAHSRVVNFPVDKNTKTTPSWVLRKPEKQASR